MNDSYLVVQNAEDQYSVWPAELIVPDGWRVVGQARTKAECLAFIEAVWTDQRPRSLRRWSERDAAGN